MLRLFVPFFTCLIFFSSCLKDYEAKKNSGFEVLISYFKSNGKYRHYIISHEIKNAEGNEKELMHFMQNYVDTVRTNIPIIQIILLKSAKGFPRTLEPDWISWKVVAKEIILSTQFDCDYYHVNDMKCKPVKVYTFKNGTNKEANLSDFID